MHQQNTFEESSGEDSSKMSKPKLGVIVFHCESAGKAGIVENNIRARGVKPVRTPSSSKVFLVVAEGDSIIQEILARTISLYD